MTQADLRSLLEARRAQWLERQAAHRKMIADGTAGLSVADAHLNELEFALEQLPVADAAPVAAAAAPAAQTKPEKRDALAECVAAIRAKFMLPLNPEVSDRMAQEQLQKLGFKFRLPTIRNAIAAINKESRASSESASSPPAASSPPEASDEGAGADNLEMPGFLKRTKEAAE